MALLLMWQCMIPTDEMTIDFSNTKYSGDAVTLWYQPAGIITRTHTHAYIHGRSYHGLGQSLRAWRPICAGTYTRRDRQMDSTHSAL